jgi:hypothetical protein
MKVNRIENMKGGWFVGNFEPTAYKTPEFEVSYKVHPKGGVSFLNLTSRKTRCFIEKEVVELNPGEVKLIPSISMKRRIVNHRIDVRVKDGWKQDSSTTLILGANRRFLFILQEDTPEGGLRRGLVTDFDPDRNLAPLAKAEPPVTATPPPADQPAK